MSWREELKLPASFRGVSFQVESAERSGGRRTVLHEFYGRDESFREDVGRKASGYPVEGFVLGDDYLDKKKALIAALEDKSGPGELIHPYYGTLQVICGDFRVQETAKDQGIASFTMNFEPTPVAPAFPRASVDTAAALAGSAAGALAAAKSEFTSLAQVGALASGALAKLTTMIAGASRQMSTLLAPLAATQQDLATLQQSLVGLQANAASLVRAPADLFDSIEGTVGALGSAGDPVAGVQALLAAYDFDPGTPRPPATTPRSAIEQVTHDANQRMIQRINLVQATLVAVEGVAARGGSPGAYPSYEDALTTRDLLTDAIDEQLEVAGDTVFPAFMQLRADLVSAVPGADSDLARLVAHTPIATVPSLVLSYNLYGNLDGEADLLARNHIRHPGFVAGGRELEVLSSV